MTLEALTDLDVSFGWDGNQSGVADLKSVIQELQGLHLTVVSGATGGVAMTVSGIATTDTVLSAWEVRHDGGADPTDRTASTYVSAANSVKCNESINANANFMVLWMDKSGR